VRRPEPVEEVDEGDPRLERGRVRDGGEILRLLNGSRSEQSPAGRADRHDVAVIAEDRQRMRGHRARGHVKDRRRELAGDLVHVRNHEEQALAGGEGGRLRPRLQGAMNGARRAPFALHVDDRRHGAPDVPAPLGRPPIGQLPHRRGRRDGIDCDHLTQLIRDVRGGFVAVHRHPWSVHRRSSGAGARILEPPKRSVHEACSSLRWNQLHMKSTPTTISGPEISSVQSRRPRDIVSA
jgi:hypothetical protein